MARYKVLPSIAHNFGQAFVGASKERSDDHLLGRLLTDARRTGEPTLRLDILTQTILIQEGGVVNGRVLMRPPEGLATTTTMHVSDGTTANR